MRFFKAPPISIQNVGLTFGSPLSGPHFPLISLQASSLHHLVEERCHCLALSVNSLVAKWRRSADGLLWLSSSPLPSPLVFAALTVHFHFVPPGGEMEPVSFAFLNSSNKKKGRSFPPLSPELSRGSWLSWARCSLGKHP